MCDGNVRTKMDQIKSDKKQEFGENKKEERKDEINDIKEQLPYSRK